MSAYITFQSLKCKDSKHGNQGMVLLNWLFQDEFLFETLSRSLANIILRKEDRYIALGWCTLVRGLLQYEVTMEQFSNNGTVAISLFFSMKNPGLIGCLHALNVFNIWLDPLMSRFSEIER